MSVIIRGMDMPDNCFKCPFSYQISPMVDCAVIHKDTDLSESKEGRRNDCPLETFREDDAE